MPAEHDAATTEDGPPMREVAPGVHIAGSARRVLFCGDPRGDDYRNAEQRVKEIRSRITRLRSELEDLGRIESRFPHDRMCDKVAGTLTLALIALYELVDGERSFSTRAERADELWSDAAANPDAYVVKDGSDWKWRPRFKREGSPDARRENEQDAAYPHPRKLEDAALRLAWAANDVSEHVMDNGLAWRRQLLHDEILNVRALVAEAREQRRAAMRDELADRAVDRETISGG